MGRRNKAYFKDLHQQAYDRLTGMQAFGESKKEAVAKFVIGEWGFDKWDEYCATLEQIGIRELEGIYQKALDATK